MEAHTSVVRVLPFSSDGPLPASSDPDWETRMWDVEAARPKIRFPSICRDIEQKSSVELGILCSIRPPLPRATGSQGLPRRATCRCGTTRAGSFGGSILRRD